MLNKHLVIAALLLTLSACGLIPQSTPAPTVTPTPPPPAATLTPMPPTDTPAPTPMLSPTPAGEIFISAYRIGRAVNLGNALEAPNEGEWGVTLTEEYFTAIKEAGFTAVRIPARFSAHAEAAVPYTIDSVFFERVDWAVEQALKNDLVAIVDMHHYLEIMEDPAGHRDRFIGLWQQIAERYQDYPVDKVYFELLNEPNTNLGGQDWNELIADTLTVVRETNPDRPVIVGPGSWNSSSQLEALILPDDPNLIVTFHYYSPFQFTHQGADWAEGSDAWLGTPWNGSRAEHLIIKSDFWLVADWAARNKRPIFLGEFGAYSEADMDSRTRWTDTIARYAEQYGFSWSYWEFCSGFGVYDPAAEEWREPLLKALIPEE